MKGNLIHFLQDMSPSLLYNDFLRGATEDNFLTSTQKSNFQPRDDTPELIDLATPEPKENITITQKRPATSSILTPLKKRPTRRIECNGETHHIFNENPVPYGERLQYIESCKDPKTCPHKMNCNIEINIHDLLNQSIETLEQFENSYLM